MSETKDSESCDNVFESTTNVTQLFQDGDSVLVRVGVREPLQQGVVVQNDEDKCQCLVKTRGGSSFWVASSAMSHDDSENDIICNICGSGVSEAPNYIILCDKCGKGFHQLCHEPAVLEMYVDSDLQWFCSSCHPQVASGDAGTLLARATSSVSARSPSSSAAHQAAASCGPYQFPYKLEALRWGDGHRENWEKTYCYCGQKGSWQEGMIQCVSCLQWFHEACLKSAGLLSNVVGCRFHAITCAVCTQARELRHRYAFQWIDVAILIFYNLTSVRHCFENGRRRTWLDFWVDIVPFAEKHWSLFAWGDKKYTANEKHCSLLKALLERNDLFVNGRDCNKRMTLFRFHDKRIPAPQPDTKVAHHQSPIPYDELPTAANLFRFTLTSDNSPEIPGHKRKRAPRAWTHPVKPVAVERFTCARASDDEDADSSPGCKRAFVLPAEHMSDSPGSVVSSSSGRLLIIPQGCARKSGDNGIGVDSLSSPSPPRTFPASSSSVQVSSSKLKVSSQSAFFPSQCHSSYSPPAAQGPGSAGRPELAPIRLIQHGGSSLTPDTVQRSSSASAAAVQCCGGASSLSAVQRGGSTSAGAAQQQGNSTSATSSLHRGAGGASVTTAVRQTSSSRSACSELTPIAKAARIASTANAGKSEVAKSPLTMPSAIAETPAKSHAAPPSDWILDRQPYNVLGVRTLPDGQRQYLLDWYVRA